MYPNVMHYVDDATQSSDDATYRLDLPNRGALHTILLKAQMTNGATAGRDVNMFDVIDEIRVVGDGSETLFSLYPEELEKWYETLVGEELQTVENETADAVQEVVFPIMFGTELYDQNYWLPLARFNDIKLEIDYSPNIAADGGFATGTFTIDVELIITPKDAQLSYNGTLTTRRINSYTSVASGEEEIELPSNSVIRAVGNYVYEAGIADGVDVDGIRLEDTATGSKIFEAGWDDFIHLNRELFGCEIEHLAVLLLTNDETWNSRIGEILNYAVAEVVSPNASADNWDFAKIDGVAGDQLTIAAANADITAGSETLTDLSTDITLKVSARGKSPSYFGLIPFTWDDQPNSWFNTEDMGQPTVIHEQAAAGANVYTSIQEYRRF